MILLCDVGNSFTKLKLYEAGRYMETSEENLPQYIPSLSKVVISSVSNNITGLTKLLSYYNYTGPIIEAKVTRQHNGVDCAYSNVTSLGIDRWLAVIGAASLWPNQACLIVDSGTATTIDGLTESKQHLGGLIMPGIHLMEKSIVDKAPGVFSNSDASIKVWPNNTPDALRTGCIRATVATIVNTFNDHFSDANIILTGGGATLISSYLSLPHIVEEDLIFKGLLAYIDS